MDTGINFKVAKVHTGISVSKYGKVYGAFPYKPGCIAFVGVDGSNQFYAHTQSGGSVSTDLYIIYSD